MDRWPPENPSEHGITRDSTGTYMLEEPQCCPRKLYFSREEIEDHSPSRKDGIDLSMESYLRKLYCSFLQDFGKRLKVPQLTIATAMMFCHRFYMCQSHAKNDWQTVATTSMFLACKVEETPCLLKDVVVVAYELIYRWDPSASKRIKQRELYDKQKELIVIGERLLLATIAFDIRIDHPYKPLVAALKRLNISHNDLAKVAWNFVNDWLCTTLCLQYKPHYIAAGSMFLAAKLLKVKLPTDKEKVWWLEFDISPKHLEEVIQQMLTFLEQNKKQASSGEKAKSTAECGKEISQGTQLENIVSATRKSNCGALMESGVPGRSVILKSSQASGDSHVFEKEALQCQTSDCGSAVSAISAISVVEDGDGEIQPKLGESAQNMGCRIVSATGGSSQIDVNRIREKLKRRQSDTAASMKLADVMDDKEWIESELENGIQQKSTHAEKKQRVLHL